jgi:hypothetical protein
MNRIKAAMIVVLGAALGACQQGQGQQAAETREQALEKRIAALEQQAQPSPSVPMDPAALNLTPEGAPAYAAPAAPVNVAPAAPARARITPKPARRQATRVVSTAPAAEPVERVNSEPVERVEPMAGTGDPGPRRDFITIPNGTELRLVLETGLSTSTTAVGDRVVARVERAMSNDGRVVLPGGTVLRGRVVRADKPGRVKGVAHLGVDFDRIVVRGREHPLRATSLDVAGPDTTKQDVAVIAGSTAAGAIIGKIMDKGAKKGAVVGAATGTGAVLVTRGEAVEMPAGSRWTVRTTDTIRLE